MHLKIPTVRDGAQASIPTQSTPHAAGYDLCAVGFENPIELKPMQRLLFRTGLRMAIPQGYVGLICPRSGLAVRYGVTVLNAPGVIDSDYRGVIGVVLVNFGTDSFMVQPGSRIAQIVFQPVMQPIFIPAFDLEQTERGAGGFGSTGLGPKDATPVDPVDLQHIAISPATPDGKAD